MQGLNGLFLRDKATPKKNLFAVTKVEEGKVDRSVQKYFLDLKILAMGNCSVDLVTRRHEQRCSKPISDYTFIMYKCHR